MNNWGDMRGMAWRISIIFMLGIGVVGNAPAVVQAQTLAELRAAHKAAYDSHALQLIKQMADAYAQLTTLDQTTEFLVLRTPFLTEKEKEKRDKALPVPEEGTLPRVPVEKPLGRTVHLMLSAPNHLRIETTDTGDGAKLQTFDSVCDGKVFWTFDSVKNLYTRERAPRQMRDFQKITLSNTTLELMMVIGINPFTDIENQFDGAKYEGLHDVRGVQTDLVTLTSLSDDKVQLMHFYIGTEDLLLHRLIVESTPIVRPMVRPVHDPLDDLLVRPKTPPPSTEPSTTTSKETSPTVAPGFEDPHPIAPPAGPTFMRITVDNFITPNPLFTEKAFQYEPPQGARLYQGVAGSNDLGKLSNTVALEEILRKARGARKGKKPRPVQTHL